MRSTIASTILMTFACVWFVTTSNVDATDAAYNVHHRHGGVGHGVVSHHGYGGNQGYGGGASVGHHVGRYSEERSTHVTKGNDYVQKDSKYYYGGQYKGTCQGDGLYYKDDTTFVMCSNGYSHQQPCPPGTKTSGSPSYKAGYYYGYTDLCSVNLVDYGLGPEHYAPVGFTQVTATKDATKEVHHQHGGRGQGGEFFAEKEVVTSFDQRPLGHHGNSHSQHVVKEKGYSGSDGSSAYVKKETDQKDVTYPGAYGSSAYPSGHHGSSGTSYASLSHHAGAGYPGRDAGAYPHRPYPAVAAHGHRSSHGVYSGINSQAAYSKDTSYSSSAETAVGAGGYPSLNAFATKSNAVYSSGQGGVGAVGVVRGTLSAVGGERNNYGYPQHGAGEYASARAFHSL